MPPQQKSTIQDFAFPEPEAPPAAFARKASNSGNARPPKLSFKKSRRNIPNLRVYDTKDDSFCKENYSAFYTNEMGEWFVNVIHLPLYPGPVHWPKIERYLM